MSATGKYVRPPDCTCGDSYYMHNIELKTMPCSRIKCDCKKYVPAEAS